MHKERGNMKYEMLPNKQTYKLVTMYSSNGVGTTVYATREQIKEIRRAYDYDLELRLEGAVHWQDTNKVEDFFFKEICALTIEHTLYEKQENKGDTIFTEIKGR